MKIVLLPSFAQEGKERQSLLPGGSNENGCAGLIEIVEDFDHEGQAVIICLVVLAKVVVCGSDKND